MKVLLLTNEYPPNIYGGAGVHVANLSRELAKLCQIDVRCFGDQKLSGKSMTVTGYGLNGKNYTAPKPLQIVFGAFQRCLDFNATNIDAGLVHCHTWYTHLGGILAKLSYSIPLVITVHSLEPLRPWKYEQLGGGYAASCWVERTALQMADAIVAVSAETKKDIVKLFNVDKKKIHIIHNGVDPKTFRPVRSPERLKSYRIDAKKPYVLFLGRLTRQKGIIHLVRAIRHMDPGFQIVLCAGAPDTPEIEDEMKCQILELQKKRNGIIWIKEMMGDPDKVALYSQASVFCCPSIYEPFGIINLEAMACKVPVVASAVGGIQEVVVDGQTGFLVSFEQKNKSPFEPVHPEKFSRDLAGKINKLMADKELRSKMGEAGRRRAVDLFSWAKIAKKTHTLYQSLIDSRAKTKSC